MVFAVVNHAPLSRGSSESWQELVPTVSSPGRGRVWTDYPPSEQELCTEAICAYMLSNTVILVQGLDGTGF